MPRLLCTQQGKSNRCSPLWQRRWQFWVAQRASDPGSERGAGKRGGRCVFGLACPCYSVTPGNVSLSALGEAGEHVPSHWPGNCVTKGDMPVF